ncbi:hypothetical protein M422DRAFT_784976 [Sphaerobolus stellatus SS14]|uniref:DUF6534 domain-containing protein n=1 Tax=Sphaerobolus stellatus (strain SS14) TaxID=990650 RepID=A0A0C9UP83_SPHS4|nr:hypothetical protein M422DRAFT_784976 [Sphaerobolus stellatus SS14]
MSDLSYSGSVEELYPAFYQGGLAYLISLFLSAGLWGLSAAQTVTYYRTYPNDTNFLKYTVAVLRLVNTAHILALGVCHYIWLIPSRLPVNYFNILSSLKTIPVGFIHYLLISLCQWYLVVLIVEILPLICDASFYAMRVYIVSEKNIYLTSIIVFFTVSQLVTGYVSVVKLLIDGSLTVVYEKFVHIAITISIVTCIACDLMICLSLAYYLKKRSVDTFEQSRDMITKLIIYSINIGVVATAFTVAYFILWKAGSPSQFLWVIMYDPAASIYMNSLLVSLNARESMRKKLRSANTADLSSSSTQHTSGMELSKLNGSHLRVKEDTLKRPYGEFAIDR